MAEGRREWTIRADESGDIAEAWGPKLEPNGLVRVVEVGVFPEEEKRTPEEALPTADDVRGIFKGYETVDWDSGEEEGEGYSLAEARGFTDEDFQRVLEIVHSEEFYDGPDSTPRVRAIFSALESRAGEGVASEPRPTSVAKGSSAAADAPSPAGGLSREEIEALVVAFSTAWSSAVSEPKHWDHFVSARAKLRAYLGGTDE